MERNDEWTVARRYMGGEALAKARLKVVTGSTPVPDKDQINQFAEANYRSNQTMVVIHHLTGRGQSVRTQHMPAGRGRVQSLLPSRRELHVIPSADLHELESELSAVLHRFVHRDRSFNFIHEQ